MSMDDNDGQMIFGDVECLKLPDICLTGEEKPRKNLTQETCPDRGSNPGPHATAWPSAVDLKTYKTIILAVVLYGCETWSLTLKEEHT